MGGAAIEAEVAASFSVDRQSGTSASLVLSQKRIHAVRWEISNWESADVRIGRVADVHRSWLTVVC